MILARKNLSEILKKNPIFQDLSRVERNHLKDIIFDFTIFGSEKTVSVKSAKDLILMVCSGEVEIRFYKKEHCYKKSTYHAGQIWEGFNIEEPHVDKIIIQSHNAVLKQLKISDLAYQPEYFDIYNKINVHFPQFDKLPAEERKAIITLNQKELKQRTHDMQNLLTLLIVILSVYILFLQHLQETISMSGGHSLKTNVSALACIFVGLGWLFYNSSIPASALGFTFNNIREVIKASLGVSLFLIISITLIKYAAFLYFNVTDIPLFGTRIVWEERYHQDVFYLMKAMGSYILLSVPLQELVFRVGLQGFLQQIYINRKTQWQPIVLTNLLFGALHVIVSPYLAIMVLFPGIAWSWLFSRHHNFIGVWLSHCIVGIYCIFVLEIFRSSQIPL